MRRGPVEAHFLAALSSEHELTKSTSGATLVVDCLCRPCPVEANLLAAPQR